MVLIVLFCCCFCGFSRCVLKWQCILYMRRNCRSLMLKMFGFFCFFFLKLSLFMCCSFFFAWVVVEGFRCVDGLFRVYTSPLTSFRKHNWERRFSLVDKCSRTILQKCSPAHCFDFSGWAKKKEKKELNKQKIPNRKSTFLHFLLVLNLLFLFYFTEDGRFTNALYIKYLYVFVKQTYDASGFL